MPVARHFDILGENQFAYTRGRGARDAIAFLIMAWLFNFAGGKKIALYCSDVAGAFDRVDKNRLLCKLRVAGLHPKLVLVIESWIRDRSAEVVVGGAKSNFISMCNMVYQGTVLGPMLWNIFFRDAGEVIRSMRFQDIVYADDLNAFQFYPKPVHANYLMQDMKGVQKNLHLWGEANGVRFDAGKESLHILSQTEPHGGDFKLLGINFDPKLRMTSAVYECVVACNWKLQSILRTKRFYSDADVLVTFKSHILSFIEYRTMAIAHAAPSDLVPLDDILTRLLVRLGISQEAALMHFKLAPLNTRRDISLLGIIHKAALRQGPPQFHHFFIGARAIYGHSRTLYDPCVGRPRLFFKRSIFGLVRYYNMLPEDIIQIKKGNFCIPKPIAKSCV